MRFNRSSLLFESLEDRRLLAAIRVASYNVLQGSPSNTTEQGYYSTILEAIGNETRAGITRPIDLLVLQETSPNSISSIEGILDSLYVDDYAFSLSPSYGGLAYGFVYNTATLQLLGTQNVSGSFTRPPLRGHFNPIESTTGDADFYAYSVHLKADSGGSDASTRAIEASQLRANADALGQGENVLIIGDFNMKNSFEGAYTNLTASGAGQVFDPINSPGNWTNNNAFKSIHTQDPSGGGGMDDRFDLQFASGELFVSGGLDYIPGTYRAFGNNGTHALNSVLTGTGAAPNVLTALRGASDHLPVVVDYEFQSVPVGITINESDGSTIVAENGYLDSYSVALDTQPDFDVTVTLTPDAQVDLGAGPGNATSLLFTPLNALTPQSVQIIAVDDSLSQGNQISPVVHSFSSNDTDYNSLSNVALDVVVVDNENPTVLINEVDSVTAGSPDSSEFIELYDGGIGNTSLTGKVLVLYDGSTNTSYSSFDLDGLTTDDNGLFVLGNATVPGVDFVFTNGLLQDGADAVALFDGDASSFPSGTPISTSNLIDAIVYDTNDANDFGLLPLLETGQPQVNENESGQQNSRSLSRLPDGGRARRTSSVGTAIPTPGSLNSPRPIGLTILNSEALAVAEGGASDSYSIALTSVPIGNVIVTLDPDNDLDLGAGAGLPIVLTFSPSSAMSPQTVTVTAADDLLIEGLHEGVIQQTIASVDAAYNSLSLSSLTVSITDNEAVPTPSVAISEIMYNPASAEGTFSSEWVEIVNLGTAPQNIGGWQLADEDGQWGAVPLGVTLQPKQVAVLFDGASTAFTSEAGFRSVWGVPSDALVVGVDWLDLANDPSATNEILELRDAIGGVQDTVNFDDENSWPSDSPEGASIYLDDLLSDNNVGTHWSRSVVGVDDAVSASGFPYSNSDVGSPGVAPAFTLRSLVITESSGDTSVFEGGSGDTFTIALDATPTDDVVITLTPDSQLDLGNGPGVAIDQTLTVSGGLSPVSISVNANEDQFAEGSHTGTISFAAASNDNTFNGLVIPDFTVSVIDNDIAGITIVESAGSTEVTEGGATDSITVVLDTIPTSNVTITITPDAQLDLGSGQGVAVDRVFTPLDALSPQVIDVTAFDDAAIEGLHSGLISLAVSSADALYESVSLSDLGVNIIDDDGISSLVLSGSVQEFAGPGGYAIDFFVTATNGPTTIGGFNVPVAFENAGFTFSGSIADYIPADVFDTNFVSPLPPPSNADFGFGSVSFSTGLSLADGETQLLFSVNVTAGLGAVVPTEIDVVRILSSGPDESNLSFSDAFFQPLTVTVGDAGRFSPSVAPFVEDIVVAGVNGAFPWSPGFVDAVDGGGFGAGNGLGYSVLGTQRILPWYTVDTFYIRFSEEVTIDGLSLLGTIIANYAGSYTISHVGSLATISMTSPFGLIENDLGPATSGIERLILSIDDGGVSDLAGNALDGNRDGTPGGAVIQEINFLPGDATGDGRVLNDDVGLTNFRSFSIFESNPNPNGFGFRYDPFFDLTSDGRILNDDVGLTNFQSFDELPAFPTQQSQRAIPDKKDDDDWNALVDQVMEMNLF
ncbi:lamin tail domain-containing protein [Rubripirellula obstinata]|nr:lamin tail domain-containing protein [Rubripirellula obstinata]